jgi:hypothetical protein
VLVLGRLRYHAVVAAWARRASPLALSLVLSACELVDPGPEVGVADRCVLAPSYFLERVAPDYIDAHGCAAEGGCHRATDANSIFRLQDTSMALPPAPGDPFSAWPEPWRENFRVTTAQVSDCDLAELAPLWSEPAGGNTLEHGGGDLFSEDGPELDLIQTWLDGGT